MTYDIKAIQRRLNELGFRDPKGKLLVVDGVKGPNTSFAIINFKKSVGFVARDYVGPLTWEALMQGSDNNPVDSNDSTIPWMAHGLAVKDLHEVRNNSALRKWFHKSVSWIDPREIAWCGAFVATCIKMFDPNAVLPDNPLGARNWGKFGKEVKPQLGAILTFWRGSKSGWQGHVGFYYGEDDTAYHVLGGNQSDAVTITRVAKNRLLNSRWPNNYPESGKVIRLSSSGKPLSTNEA